MIRSARIKRLFDLTFSLVLLVLFMPLMLLLAVAIRLTSPGPALHYSRRIGRHGKLFSMPKFRSMRIDTPDVATHLLQDSDRWITPIGHLLRKYSLDELPQLGSIALGSMSFVGPRPALHNQHDLAAIRAAAGVDTLVPGLTGWAQINGRDELTIDQKTRLDAEYLQDQSLMFDLWIIWQTAWKSIRAEGVSDKTATTDSHNQAA